VHTSLQLVEITAPNTILWMMPVIPRPPNAPPLFGGKAVIMLGGVDVAAMRRWQERVRANKDDADQPLPEHVGGNADAAGDHSDEGFSIGPKDSTASDDAAD
jgi:hypothetical protein